MSHGLGLGLPSAHAIQFSRSLSEASRAKLEQEVLAASLAQGLGAPFETIDNKVTLIPIQLRPATSIESLQSEVSCWSPDSSASEGDLSSPRSLRSVGSASDLSWILPMVNTESSPLCVFSEKLAKPESPQVQKTPSPIPTPISESMSRSSSEYSQESGTHSTILHREHPVRKPSLQHKPSIRVIQREPSTAALNLETPSKRTSSLGNARPLSTIPRELPSIPSTPPQQLLPSLPILPTRTKRDLSSPTEIQPKKEARLSDSDSALATVLDFYQSPSTSIEALDTLTALPQLYTTPPRRPIAYNAPPRRHHRTQHLPFVLESTNLADLERRNHINKMLGLPVTPINLPSLPAPVSLRQMNNWVPPPIPQNPYEKKVRKTKSAASLQKGRALRSGSKSMLF